MNVEMFNLCIFNKMTSLCWRATNKLRLYCHILLVSWSRFKKYSITDKYLYILIPRKYYKIYGK